MLSSIEDAFILFICATVMVPVFSVFSSKCVTQVGVDRSVLFLRGGRRFLV